MIGKDSRKIQVILPKKEEELIRRLAEKDNRSISNYANLLIKKQLQKMRK